MAVTFDELVMKIDDATDPDGSAGAPEHDTLLSPGLRPNVLVAPDHLRAKQAVAAALFGAPSDALQIGRFRLLNRIGAGGMGACTRPTTTSSTGDSRSS